MPQIRAQSPPSRTSRLKIPRTIWIEIASKIGLSYLGDIGNKYLMACKVA